MISSPQQKKTHDELMEDASKVVSSIFETVNKEALIKAVQRVVIFISCLAATTSAANQKEGATKEKLAKDSFLEYSGCLERVYNQRGLTLVGKFLFWFIIAALICILFLKKRNS